MDIVEEKYFEDREGYKRRRKIRLEKQDKKEKDRFILETTHLECSPEFITEQVNPRREMSDRQRKKEKAQREINERFEEWKKEEFKEKKK